MPINGSRAQRSVVRRPQGRFKLDNGRYCYPLTVTDQASRFLLACQALETTREDTAVTTFERLFVDRCLPRAIRGGSTMESALQVLRKNNVEASLAVPRRLPNGRGRQAASSGGN